MQQQQYNIQEQSMESADPQHALLPVNSFKAVNMSGSIQSEKQSQGPQDEVIMSTAEFLKVKE